MAIKSHRDLTTIQKSNSIKGTIWAWTRPNIYIWKTQGHQKQALWKQGQNVAEINTALTQCIIQHHEIHQQSSIRSTP